MIVIAVGLNTDHVTSRTNWKKVAEYLGTGKSGDNVRCRYRNKLDPSLQQYKQGPVSREEVCI